MVIASVVWTDETMVASSVCGWAALLVAQMDERSAELKAASTEVTSAVGRVLE